MENQANIPTAPRLELNGPVPDFEAETTHGPLRLSEWNEDNWVILFSHPADFTPVCTTEFPAFAGIEKELAKRNVALLGTSIDCQFINACDGGSACINPNGVAGCAGTGCCSSLCVVGDDSGCLAGQECLPWFEEGTTPDACLDGVGVCSIPN